MVNATNCWVQVRLAVKVAKDMNSLSYQMSPYILMNKMDVVYWVKIAVYVFVITVLLKAIYEHWHPISEWPYQLISLVLVSGDLFVSLPMPPSPSLFPESHRTLLPFFHLLPFHLRPYSTLLLFISELKRSANPST